VDRHWISRFDVVAGRRVEGVRRIQPPTECEAKDRQLTAVRQRMRPAPDRVAFGGCPSEATWSQICPRIPAIPCWLLRIGCCDHVTLEQAPSTTRNNSSGLIGLVI
jgi:hypothetical protein